MGDSFIPLLKRYPSSGLVNGRASSDHLLYISPQPSIHVDLNFECKGMTYRFMSNSQSFLLLCSLIQDESDNSENDNRDDDSNNKTCETTFSKL